MSTSSNTLTENYADQVLERRNEAFRVLYDTVIEAEGITQAQEIYPLLCRKLRQLCHAEVVALASFDRERQSLQLRAITRSDALPETPESLTYSLAPETEAILRHDELHCCDDQEPSLATFFPNALRFREAPERRGHCYRLACIREDELLALATFQLPLETDLMMKDLILVYLNVMGMIIQRVNSLRQLRESESYLKTLMDSVPTGIVVLDFHDHRILDCNAFATQMLKSSHDQLIGRTCKEVFCEPPNGQCPITDSHQRIDLTERMLSPSSGQPRTILKSVVPFKRHGRMLLIESFVDIEELKQTREDLALTVEQLKQSNENLKQAQSQAIQNEKMAAIGQLAAGVAHEMNTPVGFVASNFETLKKNSHTLLTLLEQYQDLLHTLDEKSPAQLQQQVDQIKQWQKKYHVDFITEDLPNLFTESQEGLERISHIVQNLRDFSRVDRAEEVHEYNLNEGIRSTLMVAHNEIKHDVDVMFDLGDIPTLLCNGGQINQVLLNLIINAVHAIRSMERDNKGTLHIQTEVENDQVICQITDDGPGIAAEIQSRIFDPFFTTKPPGQGTGLGLSVSYDIITQKHNGQIHVESQPDQGTTFTLTLPLNPLKNEFSAPQQEEENNH